MSIWSLLPAAISIGSQLINKPKKSDYTPNLDYLRRYISDLRGRQAGREVYHQAMQPALRTIGQQGRRMQRQIGYDVAKSGLGGSGIEAQQRLSAGRDVLSAMQEAGETATSAQLTESRRLGRQAENVQMQVGEEEERARQNYEQAKSQWQKNLVTTGANLAASGIDKYVAGLKTAKETAQGVNFAFKQAEAGGTLPEGVTTVEQYVQHAKGLGVTPDQLLKIGGIQTAGADKITTVETTYDETGKGTTVHRTASGETVKTVMKEKTPVKPKDPKAVRVTEEFDESGNKTITEFDKDNNVLKIRTVEAKDKSGWTKKQTVLYNRINKLISSKLNIEADEFKELPENMEGEILRLISELKKTGFDTETYFGKSEVSIKLDDLLNKITSD